ncbi:hypothetical protein [Candidatus Sororendozoicomonas aggregata]|uniref:hypothetical protein n=1 Tax=Candidatus Sororendozoicomonas aggregata TaxID=3073239 RepID=UPI002ED3699F
MKFILHARKCITKKSFIFLTVVFNLSIMGNAYSINSFIYIKNKIPPGDIYYSKKGYTVVADGKGLCMYGVYNPASHTASYEKSSYGRVGIHYSAKWKCGFMDSRQNFKVINNDRGKVAGTFEWAKPFWRIPHINMINNPGRFMKEVTERSDEPDALNLSCKHR